MVTSYYKIRDKKSGNYYASHNNNKGEVKFSYRGKLWESYSAVLNCLLKISILDKKLLSDLTIVEFEAKESSQIGALDALGTEGILQPLAKVLKFKK